MERVQDVTKIRMFQGSVMIKIVLKNQKIVAPDKSRVDNVTDYAEIIMISPDVTDLQVGDIVLDFRTSEAFDWRGDKYAIIPRMSIKIAVPKEEFINTKKKVDTKKLN
jgi:hypothetical protein